MVRSLNLRRLALLGSILGLLIAAVWITVDLIDLRIKQAHLRSNNHELTGYLQAKSLVMDIPDLMYPTSLEDFERKKEKYRPLMTHSLWISHFNQYSEGGYYPVQAVRRVVGQPSDSGDYVFKVDLLQQIAGTQKESTVFAVFEEGKLSKIYKVY